MSTQTTEPTVTTETGYAPLVSKEGGKDWKAVEYASAPDPDVQLDAAYYLASAARDGRLDVDTAQELFAALGLDRDTVITERIRVAEETTR